jgi:hypothetical protein
MDRAGKAEILGEIKESFANVASVVIVDYSGITVPVVTAMRDDFRKNGCHYRVLKNSLVKIAVKGSSMEPMSALMVGPTAVIWSNEVAPGAGQDRAQVGQGPAQVHDQGRLLRRLGPRRHRRRQPVEDAWQGRDPRQPAHDLPGRAAGLRPHADRRAAELHVPPRRAQAGARERVRSAPSIRSLGPPLKTARSVQRRAVSNRIVSHRSNLTGSSFPRSPDRPNRASPAHASLEASHVAHARSGHLQNNFRARKSFAKLKQVIEIPNLIDIQKRSYDKFLQMQGLQRDLSLEFVSYNLEKPKYDVDECRQRGMTFAAPIKVTLA